MNLEIGLTLLVIVLTLTAFIREWAAPDVIALSVLCLVVALGLVSFEQMLEVFKNEAPLTIAALFVIGGCLEKSGAVDHIGKMLRDRLSGNTRTAIFSFSLITAFFSAWMNNTAIVAIMLPATLGFARSKNIAASRLLMPLSYASILGGVCTLIGTSTNIVVNGSLVKNHVAPMTMFELAPVGIPLAIAGIIYLTVFGPRLIPARSSITGALEIENRTSPLYHLLVVESSPMVGKLLSETPMGDKALGLHVMEVRRRGARVLIPLSRLVVERNDRFLVAIHRRRGPATSPETLFESMGTQVLSTVDGIVSELVIRDESSLLGKTLVKADFRQTYNCVVLALHRNGINSTHRIAELALEVGDTLLVVTAANNLEALEATRDFILTDSPEDVDVDVDHHPQKVSKKVVLSWSVLLLVVATAMVTDLLHPHFPSIPKIPIYYAALVGSLALLWCRVITPREAYSSIDWQVLVMLYGLLGLGMAMEATGTARWLAEGLVHIAEQVVAPQHLPLLLLWLMFFLTVCLTEVLSNNATALILVPIVLTLAAEIGVSPRPFIIAVTVAASTAFALPMGYQTHMMVYGPGGYKFSDFLKVGLPLNFLCWVISCLLIPMIWSF
jgi:di/tricarboxylate transporter